ncbi:hypothetical protein J4G43_049590 [Bradyrhizobium barranii subsp. barranii]|uniref:Uncharacterized protein n=1 Tax=Bradyrhizobium barranii subsp. barranii TaxID=2823807 RepID=A0A9X9XXH8_9BRAD|nr:hypothetical protein [Bradyrhizobium barranii]UEM12372.1 hypothetical protein J4G43_049590 [Bradyrhizobium barranii subsp. barranii]
MNKAKRTAQARPGPHLQCQTAINCSYYILETTAEQFDTKLQLILGATPMMGIALLTVGASTHFS